MNNYWYLTYIALLIITFNIPNKLFITATKNVVLNKSIKYGLYFSLGITTFFFTLSIVIFLLCLLISKQPTYFMFVQLLCLCYLSYIGITIMTQKNNISIDNDSYKVSNTIKDCFIDGFYYSFANLNQPITISFLIFIFYDFLNRWYDFIFIIFAIPTICFISYICIAMFSSKKILNNKTIRNIIQIYNIFGFIFILLLTLNIKIILKW